MIKEDQLIKKTTELVINSFELDLTPPDCNEAELLDLIGDVVAELMEKRLEYFMQILYSMDVSEEKIRAAFLAENEEPANVTIAKAILERQKQRAYTKLTYKRRRSAGDWFDFEEEL